ncbi:MAG: CDP-alcohol phosphatidyltransferase family protein [Pseudomonadota bacterium]
MKEVIPNLLTLSRLVLMPVSLYFLAEGSQLKSAVIYIFIALTDFFDGYLARRLNACSPSGIVLDQVSDKLVGLGFFCGLTFLGLCPVWFLSLLFLTSLLMGFGYFLSQFITQLSGPQTTLKLGKWNTGLQYIWIGWLLFFPYLKVLNQLGFIVLGILQIWVFGLYAFRMYRSKNRHSPTNKMAGA